MVGQGRQMLPPPEPQGFAELIGFGADAHRSKILIRQPRQPTVDMTERRVVRPESAMPLEGMAPNHDQRVFGRRGVGPAVFEFGRD